MLFLALLNQASIQSSQNQVVKLLMHVAIKLLGCPRKVGSMVSKWVIPPIYPMYK